MLGVSLRRTLNKIGGSSLLIVRYGRYKNIIPKIKEKHYFIYRVTKATAK
jgi:hypothetical protein